MVQTAKGTDLQHQIQKNKQIQKKAKRKKSKFNIVISLKQRNGSIIEIK